MNAADYGFLGAIVGALVGGLCSFLGSYYLSKLENQNALKNIARAIDIDLEYVYKSNKNWYDYFKMPDLLDTEKTKYFYPPYKLYNDNGAYFIFNYDIAKFGYELSSKIYIFYSRLLAAESERQFVDKYEDAKDDWTTGRVRISYAEMQGLVVWTEEQIPEIRKKLKEIYDC